MSIEQPNPYLAPSASITHERIERGNLLTNVVIGVCVVLTAALLVGQQIARIRFDGYGLELPFLTDVLLNPLAACVPLLFVPLVGVARSWSNRWRVALCTLALIFMFFYATMFWYSMYLPDRVIRERMGI